MKTKFLEEFEKTLRGEPSSIKLTPISEEELAVERKLHEAGYEFAFGRGWNSRAEFVEWLINRSGSDSGLHIESETDKNEKSDENVIL